MLKLQKIKENNMQELLKYQHIDGELRRLNAELNSSESRKKVNEMQQYMRETQNKIIALDGVASGILEALNKIKKEYASVVEKIEQLLKTDACDDAQDEASRLAEKLSRLERELNNLQTKLVSVSKDFDTFMKNAVTAKNNLKFHKQAFEKQKEEVEPKINKLTTELAEQKKKVRAELMAKYQAKADGKYFPVFVPLKDNRCGGCRMEVPAGKIKDLQSKQIIECENCGRIIYLA